MLPEIIARLSAECTKLLAQPEVKARFAEIGLENVDSTPTQFDQ